MSDQHQNFIRKLSIRIGAWCLVLFLTLPVNYSWAGTCVEIVGQWKWSVGGTVTFSEDHRGSYMPGGQSALPPAQASWSCDAQSGTYSVNWSNGFIDTLRLSPDGNIVSGHSSSGVAIFGTRYVVTEAQLAASTCGKVLGDWDWFNGGRVTFFDDNRVVFESGNSRLPDGSGTWACDPVTGTYSVAWLPGFNESLNLSSDGNTLSGRNVIGHAISGTRPGTRSIKSVDCSQAADTRGEGACAFVTAGDLCRITGKLFSAGNRIVGNQSDTCRFRVIEGFNQQIEVGTTPDAKPSHRQGFLNVLKNKRTSPAYHSIPGLGDIAYAISDAYNKTVRLHILKDNKTFLVKMTGKDYRLNWKEEEIIAQASALGKRVIAGYGGGVEEPVQQTVQIQQQIPERKLDASGLGLTKPGSPGVDAYLLALDALEQAQWAQAIQHLNTALQLEPENPDYLTARGVAYTLARRLKDAEVDLEQANRLRPNHKPTKLWWATAIGMQGRFEEDSLVYPFATHDQYESAVRRMSHEFGEKYFRQSMGDELAVQQAQPAYEQAIRSFPTLAQMFVERAKPGKAVTDGSQGASAVARALRKRGIERYKSGLCQQAYADLSHAYQADPDDKEVLYFLAGCKLQLGSPEGARADYTSVLLDQPGNANAVMGRALAHAALGDAPAARKGLADARNMHPKLSTDYDKQIERDLTDVSAALSEQDKERMLEELRLATQQDADWQALTQHAVRLVRANQHGRLRADERYQIKLNTLRAAAAEPGAGAERYAALGQFLYEQALITVGEAVEPHAQNRPYRPQTKKSQERELAQAEEAVDHALALDPNHPRALAFKGACRFKRANEWVLAEEYLSRAIELDDKDPVIQDLFAIVLDYIAFVQAAAAADLRSVDTWSDAYYIYYRYPSEAELRRADELDALARRLWKKARRAIEKAIAVAPSTAQADYYRSILAEHSSDLIGAAGYLKRALEADPEYFEAAQRLSTIATKIGQTELAYTAQSIATNLVHTSAAPMLKLAWIEFNRSAYETTSKALKIAGNLDPSDPRVAAYLGAVAREKGDHPLAASWFIVAAVLEEVRLFHLGIKVREKEKTQYRPDDISRLLVIQNAAATELNLIGQPKFAAGLMDVNFNVYSQISQQGKYTKSPYGLLPTLSEDPTRLPEAPTLEALTVWSAVNAAKANAALNRLELAMQQYQWAAAFESRKPPTMDQGMVVRIPGLWAKLGMVDVELRRGNSQMAAQYMQGYGHPKIATPALRIETDRLRNALEAAGYRSGGQTLSDKRDQLRRQNQQQSEKQVW